MSRATAVAAADPEAITVTITAGQLTAILSDLIAVDADYGSDPPRSLRELGQVLAHAIQAVPDLALSATGPLAADLAALHPDDY